MKKLVCLLTFLLLVINCSKDTITGPPPEPPYFNIYATCSIIDRYYDGTNVSINYVVSNKGDEDINHISVQFSSGSNVIIKDYQILITDILITNAVLSGNSNIAKIDWFKYSE